MLALFLKNKRFSVYVKVSFLPFFNKSLPNFSKNIGFLTKKTKNYGSAVNFKIFELFFLSLHNITEVGLIREGEVDIPFVLR